MHISLPYAYIDEYAVSEVITSTGEQVCSDASFRLRCHDATFGRLSCELNERKNACLGKAHLIRSRRAMIHRASYTLFVRRR
jgi:hypothetical protein